MSAIEHFIAQDKGYFRDEGLDVKLVQIRSSVAIAAAVAGVWFQDLNLALVMAIAMVINMVVAGLAGTAIPLGLAMRGIDPAVASAVFLTTVTDVVGFFAFLGLAAWVLL